MSNATDKGERWKRLFIVLVSNPRASLAGNFGLAPHGVRQQRTRRCVAAMLSKAMRTLLFLGAIASYVAVPASAASSEATTVRPADSLSFGGAPYVHRWSKAGQHEFTPRPDADLTAWRDMLTIIVYPSVKDGDALAATANNVLGNYQRTGKILRTNSLPRTDQRPAQHFIAAVLGQPSFLEAVFARLVLVDGTGYAVVYSHRVYGQSVGPAMSQWLDANGPKTEETLMGWNGIPSLSAISALPQSK